MALVCAVLCAFMAELCAVWCMLMKWLCVLCMGRPPWPAPYAGGGICTSYGGCPYVTYPFAALYPALWRLEYMLSTWFAYTSVWRLAMEAALWHAHCR